METGFGALTVRAGPDGLRGIAWGRDAGPEAPARPDREPSAADRTAEEAARQLAEYARGERRGFELPVALSDQPPFRRRVLEELAGVPYGETVTYGRLAGRCGRPRAARAVGNALGRNPLPVVLPCHRVVRSDGTAGGYGGGRERKRRLLRLEGALPREGDRGGPRAKASG